MSTFRIIMIVLCAAWVSPVYAAKPQTDTPDRAGQDVAAGQNVTAGQDVTAGQEQRYKQFVEQMSGVKLVGRFTVLGKEEGPLPKEEYTIKSVTKIPKGDYWLITARIKYGRQDLTLPLLLQVKWAADTPVITLSELAIPGLGTFSSRVVIYNKKYAGTWTHGKVGGHLFGTIEKLDTDTADQASR